MVFRKISADMKSRALSLYYAGHLPKDLCQIFGFSEKSLQRWKDNLYEHGDVVPPTSYRQGRPRKLNSDQTSDLMAQLMVDPSMYLDEIQTWIAIHQEVGISKSSLARLIEDAGFSYKSLHKAAVERDEGEREEFRVWAQDTLVPEMIVAADESSKDDRTIYRHYGRSPSGVRAAGSTQFVRGERYSLIAAMSVDGYISTRVVEGSVNAAEFFDFIVGEVVSVILM
jgi:transposase